MPMGGNSGGAQCGDVKWWPTANAPPGWLKANGAAVSRAAYAALFDVIGTAYGVGDGSTTFNLPDLRGEFIRGWDDGRGVDSGRAIGTAQAEAVKVGAATSAWTSTASTGITIASGASSNWFAAVANGAETRPRNVAKLMCIKF